MSRKVDAKRKNFSSRSSLAKPKNSNHSYKERLSFAEKKEQGIDFDAPINSDGYILLR
ncbi:hypothetical protein [Aeromonas veronii]|uniref:hypothetical protein n=1 Tax=Aeromonas veronii TaxID=654 RepID=UPI001F3B4460|nr:hypothetical protein [Aeromonas veronii]MCF5842702.1 hypothetical protein [Aeromonas veronii]